MSMHVKISGTWRDISIPSVRVAGVWRMVTGGWVRIAGVWRSFIGFFAVAAPSSVTGPPANAPGTINTTFTTATPYNGTGPYTYQWEFVSGTVVTLVTSATSASTTFLYNKPSSGAVVITSVYRCKVTDATAAFVYTNGVNITFTFL